MARPRVFLSSTFYDLRQIRADLERFIKQLGYEPILHERGKVPYGSEKKLEHYCYKELRDGGTIHRLGSTTSKDCSSCTVLR
jgi:hypothetical protein